MAAGSLLNQLRPRARGDRPDTAANVLGGLGGLAAAAYGLSGGRFEEVVPTLRRVVGRPAVTPGPLPAATTGGPPAAAGDPLQAAGHVPALAKFFGPDGAPDVRALVAASDAELKSGLSLLSPARRAQLKTQLANFRPSPWQAIGARAAGVDLDAQRARFAGLLGG